MLTSTFIFFTVFYIILLLILDVPFLIAFYGFNNPLDEEDLYCKEWFCIQWQVTGIIAVIYFFVALVAGVIILRISELKFLWSYLTSPFGVFILLINTVLTVILCFIIMGKNGWYLASRLYYAKKKNENIKACIARIKDEIKSIEHQIAETANTQTKEVMLASKKTFVDELSVYQTIERANEDLQASLMIRLHNHNFDSEKINTMLNNYKEKLH